MTTSHYFCNLINWRGRKRFCWSKTLFPCLTNYFYRGAYMAGQCLSINITTFPLQQVDYVVAAYHVTWDSVVLLTGRDYHEQPATLVVDRAGKTLLIRRPLTMVLRQFFTENCISEADNRVCYRMLGMPRVTRAAVAGKYQLVPTCGTANEEVVWVMTHHLVHAEIADRKNNNLCLQFTSAHNHAPLLVTVQWCAKSFLNNMQAADQVAHLQLELADFRQYCHGLAGSKVEFSDFQRRRRLQHQLVEYNQLLCIHQHELVMKRAFEQKTLTPAERAAISQLGFKPFTPYTG